MAWELERQAALSASISIEQVRKVKLEATQRLLGDSISLSDRAWQEPGKLPGWTRAHIATHIARNADALSQTIDGLFAGRQASSLYESEEARMFDIERGSERTGLELQIDLDASAGNLHRHFGMLNELSEDSTAMLTPDVRMRVDLLPLARLFEVVIHHIDLDLGFKISELSTLTARWLLEWTALTYDAPHDRAIQLLASSGFSMVIGQGKVETILNGPDAVLLGWLTGRLNADEALDLPTQPSYI